jgi:hypothetical protein
MAVLLGLSGMLLLIALKIVRSWSITSVIVVGEAPIVAAFAYAYVAVASGRTIFPTAEGINAGGLHVETSHQRWHS